MDNVTLKVILSNAIYGLKHSISWHYLLNPRDYSNNYTLPSNLTPVILAKYS